MSPTRIEWERHAPALFSIVTGFFPEVSPKETWATNPRPLMVCGVARDPETRMHFCRVAYGTTQKLHKAHPNDIVIGNVSMLNSLGLKKPTRFVIYAGSQMAIMPWTQEFFRPWSGYRTPVLSVLDNEVQNHARFVLGRLADLPRF